MTCTGDKAHLLLDGRVPESERASIEEHVRGCARCQSVVESWRGITTAYQSATRHLLAPPSQEDVFRLMRKARARSERRAPRWGLAVASACALALLVLGLFFRSAPTPIPALAVATNDSLVPLEGEVVDVPADRGQVLMLKDDRIGLAPRSRLHLIRHDSRDIRMRLERGSVAAAVQHRAKNQSFIVEAGDYEVVVVGTRFRVTQKGDGVRVEVAQGHVQVRSVQGKTFDVFEKQSLDLGAAGATPAAGGELEYPELEAKGSSVSDAGAGTQAPLADAGAETAEAPVADAGVEAPVEPSKHVHTPGSQVERWRTAAASGHCAQVVDEMHRAIASEPDKGGAWQIMADCQRLKGDAEAAARSYRQVMRVGNAEEAGRARLILAGLLQDQLGQPAEAERILREYLRAPHPAPLEASARLKRAQALVALHREADARAELLRITRQLSGTPAALEALELLKRLPEH
jgi:ferric-dicitrate binding protein FerR (iron transport regulator)